MTSRPRPRQGMPLPESKPRLPPRGTGSLTLQTLARSSRAASWVEGGTTRVSGSRAKLLYRGPECRASLSVKESCSKRLSRAFRLSDKERFPVSKFNFFSIKVHNFCIAISVFTPKSIDGVPVLTLPAPCVGGGSSSVAEPDAGATRFPTGPEMGQSPPDQSRQRSPESDPARDIPGRYAVHRRRCDTRRFQGFRMSQGPPTG